uniref:Sushi, von Willebrand factor type A, EGF and pentraxin domain-containing protein 1-like n=1 Tax=Branchiostoma floridae TaxID=7739 RepID=C3XPW7_BRAFL|eukprot:XP_002613979.1 hypothetical protein BRAFLDRAFT_67440 [Branchiostoma floridae]
MAPPLASQIVLFAVSAIFLQVSARNLAQVASTFQNQVNKYQDSRADIVFMLDSSGSVGENNFQTEITFVENFLSQLTISPQASRVAIVSFDDAARTHIDYIKNPKNKCSFLRELKTVKYTGGSTNAEDAFRLAQELLRPKSAFANNQPVKQTEITFVENFLSQLTISPQASRVAVVSFDNHARTHIDYINSPKNKCSFLRELKAVKYTGGSTNAEDGFRLAQELLRPQSAFTNYQPVKQVVVYLTDGKPDKDPVGRANNLKSVYNAEIYSIGVDPYSKRYETDGVTSADCSSPGCGANAECACGSKTGVYECACKPGYYGTGRGAPCTPCPKGRYKELLAPSVSGCPGTCPAKSSTRGTASTSPNQCVCNEGHEGNPWGSGCKPVRCDPKLEAPDGGTMQPANCNNQYLTKCQFQCNYGHKMLRGTQERTCHANRTWSGDPIICQRIECPGLPEPSDGQRACVTSDGQQATGSFPYETTCTFTCNRGYTLQGSKVRRCLEEGKWDGSKAKCLVKKCDPLPMVVNATVSPSTCVSKAQKFDTACQFTCQDGYRMDGTPNRVCLEDDSWSNQQPTCIDNQSPRLVIGCPADIVNGTEEGQNYLTVNWTVPTAVDNSGKPPKMTVTPAGIKPPHKFPITTGLPTVVKYTFTDGSGMASSCSFEVRVNATRCIHQDPPFNGALSCDEFQFGQFCTVQCNEGFDFYSEPARMYICGSGNWRTDPHGLETKWPDCSLKRIPGYSKGIEFQYYVGDCEDEESQKEIKQNFIDLFNSTVFGRYGGCVGNVKCSVDNVALSCSEKAIEVDWVPEEDGGLDGPSRKKRSVQRRARLLTIRLDVKTQYKTTESAQGESKDIKKKMEQLKDALNEVVEKAKEDVRTGQLSDIAVTAGGGQSQIVSLARVAGSAEDAGIRDLDTEAVLSCYRGQILKEDFCGNVKCSVDNVALSCSEKAIEVDWVPEEDGGLDGPSRKKRSVRRRARLLTIRLDVKTQYKTTESAQGESKYIKKKMEQLKDALNEVVEKAKEDVRTGQLSDIAVTAGEGQSQIVSLARVAGSAEDAGIRDLDTEAVLSCYRGQILKEDFCVSCPVGTYYTDVSGEATCDVCPVGSYQDEEGQTECIRCEPGFFTAGNNSKNATDCRNQCQPGTFSETGLETCMFCPKGTYQNKQGATECIPCEEGTTTGDVGTVDKEDCSGSCVPGSFSRTGTDPCDLCPVGTFQPGHGQTDCLFCPLGLGTDAVGSETSSDCVDTDYCQSSPCQNGGSCTMQGSEFNCLCPAGFEGDMCDVNVNECASLPCYSLATCLDRVNGYECVCPSGWTGEQCDVNIDECAPAPCLNGATCVDEDNGFLCLCADGYSGTFCEVNIDDCSDSPCNDTAVCVDLVDSFQCLCQDGYTGKYCEVDINDCEAQPCQNGGKCTDEVGRYTCQCTPGFVGYNCELNVNECASSPCLNRAYCEDKINSYLCHCAPGFGGTHCEDGLISEVKTKIDQAKLQVVRTREHSLSQRFVGPCAPGSFSQTGTDPCDLCPMGTFQARHGETECLSCPLGTGTDAVGSEASSDCVDIDECLGNPCGPTPNRCQNSPGSFSCQCGHGYEPRGMTCVDWPTGTYGLPRTNTGCPESAGVTWHTGYRYHDTEDDGANNYWTSGLHFDGDFWRGNMYQKFCMKTSSWQGHGTWPRGSYCIFKRSGCPSGFQTGELFWDDEDDNNANRRSGVVPDGTYNHNTLIWYCCRNDGSANTRIPLPSRKPFYLFRFRQGCQKVLRMNVREEYFRWDDEDDDNINYRRGAHPYDTGGSRDHKLHYCYYW